MCAANVFGTASLHVALYMATVSAGDGGSIDIRCLGVRI